MSFTEEDLRQAAAAFREARLASLPAPEDCAEDLSPRFYRNMRPLLRRMRHPVLYQAMRQAAACFLAVLVLGGGWLTVDTNARASFFQWVREVYETQIAYRFTGLPTEGETGVYRPAWVPEGYQEAVSSDDIVIYYNEENRILSFQYNVMQEGTAIYVVDADKATLTHVEINGIPGELYLSTDPALANGLIWLDESTGMAFSISGFLEESDILHMAESVYLVDSTN